MLLHNLIIKKTVASELDEFWPQSDAGFCGMQTATQSQARNLNSMGSSVPRYQK